MNERIAKLANQSGFDVDATGKFGNYSEIHRLEKFAELIVRECSKYIEDKFDFCGDEIVIAESVLKHFGVEE